MAKSNDSDDEDLTEQVKEALQSLSDLPPVPDRNFFTAWLCDKADDSARKHRADEVREKTELLNQLQKRLAKRIKRRDEMKEKARLDGVEAQRRTDEIERLQKEANLKQKEIDEKKRNDDVKCKKRQLGVEKEKRLQEAAILQQKLDEKKRQDEVDMKKRQDDLLRLQQEIEEKKRHDAFELKKHRDEIEERKRQEERDDQLRKKAQERQDELRQKDAEEKKRQEEREDKLRQETQEREDKLRQEDMNEKKRLEEREDKLRQEANMREDKLRLEDQQVALRLEGSQVRRLIDGFQMASFLTGLRFGRPGDGFPFGMSMGDLGNLSFDELLPSLPQHRRPAAVEYAKGKTFDKMRKRALPAPDQLSEKVKKFHKVRQRLVEEINGESVELILDQMRAARDGQGLFTSEERKDIRSQATTTDKVRHLLDVIGDQGECAIDVLVLALKSPGINRPDLAELLSDPAPKETERKK